MFVADLRYAVRLLSRNPGFALAAVLTLGLGIGATTTMFSVVDAVLLESLPFGDPDRLVEVQTVEPTTGRRLSVSYPDYLDWRAGGDAFEELAAVGQQPFTITGAGAASLLEGELVSADYFQTLGITPARGRAFTAAEDRPGRGTVVVLSDRVWRDRFGAAVDLVGSTLTISGAPYTVIGVAPRGFAGYGGSADLWIPIGMFDTVNPDLRAYDILGTRATRWHSVIGRLDTGRTMEEGRSSLDVVAARLADRYPDSNAGKATRLTSAREALVGDLRTPLLTVLGAAAMLLLVACANIATLLLARSSRRAREFAIRASLGAGWGRTVRQLLVESTLLGLLGAGVGLLFAAWVLDALMALAPPEIPNFVTVGIDGRVATFALLSALVTTVVFGLAPAVGMARRSPVDALKGTSSNGRHPFRGQAAFLVAQLAIALTLGAGAGLMIRSSVEMQRFEPGFDVQRLATARISIPPGTYPAERAAPLLETLRARLDALPGIESAAFSSHVYYGGGYLTTRLVSEAGVEPADREGWSVQRQFVGPGYFETLGIPLRDGRPIEARDGSDMPPVAVISESLARRLWPGESPVGRRVAFDPASPDHVWVEVVGVVGNVRAEMTWGPDQSLPQVYTPMLQAGAGGTPGLLLRTRGNPADAIEPARRVVAEIDSNIPLYRAATMGQLLSERTARTRFVTIVLGIFAALALLLASVGIYGVVSQVVAGRVREIGVRLALGAEPWHVVRLVSKQAMVLTATGVGLGLLGAVVAGRFLTSLLFGVAPSDLTTLLFVTAALTGVALLATYLPARRAVRIDPLTVLRTE